MKKTLYSLLWHIFIICFKFIQIFRLRFSACATVITHTAFDWLFRHALLSIKTSTSFLKGSNRGICICALSISNLNIMVSEIHKLPSNFI